MSKNNGAFVLHHFIAEHTDLGVNGNCRSYSGRGMYGTKCLGVTVPNFGELLVALADAAADHPQEYKMIDQELVSVRWDSMGHDIIVYFPDAQFDETLAAEYDCSDCDGCEKCNPDDEHE